MSMKLRFLFIAAGVFTLCATVKAEDDSQWLMHYYKNPEPAEISARLQGWQKSGYLSPPNVAQQPFIGFLSRVMRDNPDKVNGWLRVAESFLKRDRQTVFTAAWYSDTKPSHSYFEDKGLREFVQKRPPDIANLPIDSPAVLDFYWATYFASGDPAAIRRIISALEFQKYSGAIERYKTSKQTDEDKQAAMKDAIFQSATWSLTANCQQDQKILAVCRNFLNSGKLSKPEETFLGVALSKVKPDEIKVELPTTRN